MSMQTVKYILNMAKEMGVPVTIQVNVGSQPETTVATGTSDSTPKKKWNKGPKKPYWDSEFKGTKYIFASTKGTPYSAQELTDLGMKQSAKEGKEHIFSAQYTDMFVEKLEALAEAGKTAKANGY